MVLNILGARVKVINKHPESFDHAGQAHFKSNEIWIDSSLKGQERQQVLCHEIMHFALHRSGLREGMDKLIEEALCDIVGFVFSENNLCGRSRKKGN